MGLKGKPPVQATKVYGTENLAPIIRNLGIRWGELSHWGPGHFTSKQ